MASNHLSIRLSPINSFWSISGLSTGFTKGSPYLHTGFSLFRSRKGDFIGHPLPDHTNFIRKNHETPLGTLTLAKKSGATALSKTFQKKYAVLFTESNIICTVYYEKETDKGI
jgi:hypothetical protein